MSGRRLSPWAAPFLLLPAVSAIPPPPPDAFSTPVTLAAPGVHCGASTVEDDEEYVGAIITAKHCRVPLSTNCTVTYKPMTCPDECPFFSPNSQFSCLFECAYEAECADYNPARPWADKNLSTCMPCGIQGCHTCNSDNPSICDECQKGFKLQEHHSKCVFVLDTFGIWGTVGKVLLGLIVVVVVLGLIWGCCGAGNKLAEVNNYSILRARRHRHLVKTLLWEMNNKRAACYFPDFGFDFHHKNIVGVGIALFYNNIAFTIGFSFVCWMVTQQVFSLSRVGVTLGNFDGDAADLYSHGLIPGAGVPAVVVSRLHVCAGSETNHVKSTISTFAKYNFYGLLMLWLMAYIGLVLFVKYQKLATAKFNAQNSMQADFAVRICGLPKEETDENKIRDWVQKKLREIIKEKLPRPPLVVDKGKVEGDEVTFRADGQIEVHGVSLCYAYLKHWGDVDNALANFTMRLEVECGMEANKKMEEISKSRSAQEVDMRKQLNLPVVEERKLRHEHIGGKEESDKQAESARELMKTFFEGPKEQRIKTNGEAFVVFNYSDDVTHLWQTLGKTDAEQLKHPLNQLVYDFTDSEGKKHAEKVRFTYVRSEPPSVNWQFLGQQVTKKKVASAMVWIMFLTSLVVIVIALYYQFILLPYSKLGANASGAKTAVMGNIIGALNTIVGIQTWMTSFNVGFHRREQMDVMVFVCNMINTTINLMFMVLVVKNQAFSKIPLTSWSAFTDISSLDVVGVEYEMGNSFFQMMFPGFFFIGNFMTLIMAGIWPWIFNTFLAKVVYVWAALPKPLLWAIRPIVPWAPDSIDYLPLWRAEKMLEPMEIQIGDNANLIVIPTLVSITLFVLSEHTHVLYKYMFFWAIFYYFWLRWIHLRFCKKCYYTTSNVDNIVNYCWGIPLSVIACACCQWGFRGGVIMRDTDGMNPDDTWDGSLKNFLCFCAFVLSYAIWFVSYHWGVKPWTDDLQIGASEEQRMTVDECKDNNTVYSWYNCNPVFSLKCEYYWKDKKNKFHTNMRRDHPIASGEQHHHVRFFSVGKEYLFLKPERQHLAFPAFRHRHKFGDFFEFETWLETMLHKMPSMSWRKPAVGGKEPEKDPLLPVEAGSTPSGNSVVGR